MDDRKASIAELARVARTHLEYLSELGVEATEELTWPHPARVSPIPAEFARPTSRIPPTATARPTATKEITRPAPASPPAARLADLPRLGAPRSDQRPKAPVPRVPTETESMRRSPTKSVLNSLLTAEPEAPLAPTGESLTDIREAIGDCTRCPLHEGRTQIVHTEGTPSARLMFVGEAPGADEDAQGRPFVGRAGQLLNKIIEAIGLRRDEVLIGNINRCRPPQNRAPLPNEVAECKPFIMREIAAVKPEVVVVLGNTAMKNLLGTKEGITKMRGRFHDYRGIKVMPTFHPAYLLRDPSKKRETWEDLKQVRDYLNRTRKEP